MGSMSHYGIYSQSMVTLNSMAGKSGFADDYITLPFFTEPYWIRFTDFVLSLVRP